MKDGPRAPEPVDVPWDTLVLVCAKCRGARHGPDAREVRKGLKRLLDRPKRLRIVEVDCLRVCPDHAVTVCVVARAAHAELFTVGSEAELEGLAATLSERD